MIQLVLFTFTLAAAPAPAAPGAAVATPYAKLSPIEKVWQREAIAAKCSQEEGLEKLPPVEALGQLEAIHWLGEDEIALIRQALAEDFGDAFLRWVVVAHSDCASQRLKFSRAVMNGPRALGPRLLATLARPKAPTLLNLMIDVIVFQEGLRKGVFEGPGGLVEDVQHFREDLKRESVALEPEGKIFDDEHVGETAPTADAIARFKASKNLARMHAAADQEWEVSVRGFTRFHELIARAR